jgi:threonine aldolase
LIMIDLRSDTCSPTEAMRRAMAEAAVGDDVYSDDSTVRLLEERTAALLGKEDAVYMVTGTMTNQMAIRAHTEPGDGVLFDQNAHLYLLGGGAPASLSGVLPRLLPGIRGIFSPQDVAAAGDAPSRFSGHNPGAREAALRREHA